MTTVWMNGKEVECYVEADTPIIAVIGKRGVGKSAYCKCMSKHHRDTLYIETQTFSQLHTWIRSRVIRIIEIREREIL
jgi:ABC-type phosphate/phosphonate transport system ATPase subunit